jgi:uncharacterized protein HemX
MSGGFAAVAAIAAVVGTGTAIYSANQSRSATNKQQDAQDAATAQAKQDAITADATRPQGAQTPDNSAIRQKAATSAITGPSAGNASTFLTGPSGIDNSQLNIGKSTLLGQ